MIAILEDSVGLTENYQFVLQNTLFIFSQLDYLVNKGHNSKKQILVKNFTCLKPKLTDGKMSGLSFVFHIPCSQR